MSLLVAPMAVYVASNLMLFVQHGPAVGEFVSLQAAMFHHQWIHSRVQVQASAPISWPLLAHPIRYLWDSAATREVVLVGNPLLWWGFLAALPLLVSRRRYRTVVRAGSVAGLHARCRSGVRCRNRLGGT
jgi:dolichyl-phosphate-mannose--protein O-mannosyl transferase